MNFSYDSYIGFFGDSAKIPESAFYVSILRAILEVSRYLTVPADEIEEDSVPLCIFECAELMYAEAMRDGIISENVDGYSVSFDGKKPELYPVIARYLPGYIYRGVSL